MKLLVIGPLPNPIDGCSISNYTLCKNLDNKGITYKTINTNTKVVSSKQGSRFSLKKALSFCKVYLKINFIFFSDIIYTTPGQTFFGILKYSPFYILCILLRKPYVIHVHGNYLGTEFQSLKGLKKSIFKYFVSSSSRGIVLSDSLIKNFDNLLPSKKVYVVENFASQELYENYIPEKKERREPTLLFLSNLIKEKGAINVLDALIILKKKNIKFKAYFAGKIEKEYQTIISEKLNHLSGCVEYLGIVKGQKKYDILNKSNIFILPTYYKMEGQPISILEAMAMGNIIITTKHAGIVDIVSDKNGFFVEKKNPDDIAKKITEISNDILAHIQKFEKFNIKYAKENFTEELFSEKIIKILYGAVEEKGS